MLLKVVMWFLLHIAGRVLKSPPYRYIPCILAYYCTLMHLHSSKARHIVTKGLDKQWLFQPRNLDIIPSHFYTLFFDGPSRSVSWIYTAREHKKVAMKISRRG